MRKRRGGEKRGRKARKYKEGNTGSESPLPGVIAWRAGVHSILTVKEGAELSAGDSCQQPAVTSLQCRHGRY